MEIITQNTWGMQINRPLQELNLSQVDTIALHHMAHPTADIKSIEMWHLKDGLRAIGYNFWVSLYGKIYECRGFNIGACVENQNAHVISIGFQGDYSENKEMPKGQFNAGIDVINYIKGKVPEAKVVGHRDLVTNDCPGLYFPLIEFQRGKKRDEIEEYTEIDDIVWDLCYRGFVSQGDELASQMKDNPDGNLYWLARRMLQYIREMEVK